MAYSDLFGFLDCYLEYDHKLYRVTGIMADSDDYIHVFSFNKAFNIKADSLILRYSTSLQDLNKKFIYSGDVIRIEGKLYTVVKNLRNFTVKGLQGDTSYDLIALDKLILGRVKIEVVNNAY